MGFSSHGSNNKTGLLLNPTISTWPQLSLSSCNPGPHLFQVVSGRLLSLKAFDSIPLASPVLLWETVGDHSMHGKVSLLRAKCAGWWTELHCLCVRMIWGQCWSFNNAENKFISLCASSCARFCGKGNCQTWNTEEQGRFYAKLLSRWRSLIALTLRDEAEKIGDPCTRGHHAPVVLTEMEKK